jgi:UDPglucose 6-dehydrogenase
MTKPAFIFDGRNILDLQRLKDIGFRVSGIGK